MRKTWRRCIRIQLGLLACLLALTHEARAQDSTVHRQLYSRIWPILGLRAGTPALLSLGAGALYTTSSDGFIGPFVSIEPGLRAGRASAGYSIVGGNLAAGWAFRASFLRRYRGDVQRNYAGLEAQFMAALVGPRIGLFRSLTGSAWLFAADFGIGF